MSGFIIIDEIVDWWPPGIRFEAELEAPKPEGRAALLASSALWLDCPDSSPSVISTVSIIDALESMPTRHASVMGAAFRRWGKSETMRQALERAIPSAATEIVR